MPTRRPTKSAASTSRTAKGRVTKRRQAAAGKRGGGGGGRGGRKVGYAVVGLGHIAQAAVLPAFANAKKSSRLAALVTGDPQKAKKLGSKYKVPVYSYEQFEECLASPEVDAVYIALPNDQHLEFTERAARSGVHVLCEKPMALSADDCQRMIRVCDENDVKLMVAYRLHLEPGNLHAIDVIQKGRIGEPRYFSSTFSFQVKDENIRVQKEKGGGVLWDIGIYCINATRYLFRSEPVEVFAQAVRGEDPRFSEVEEAVSATLRFPDARLASFVVSFGAAPVARYQVVGTKGDITLENAYEYEGELRWTVRRGEKEDKGKVRARDQFGPELEYFSNCVLRGTQPEPSGREGLADVRIIEALYQSIESGRPVSLQPFEKLTRPDVEQEREQPPVEEPSLVEVEAPAH